MGYRQKCDKCGEFEDNEKMSRGFGHRHCLKCSCTQKIGQQLVMPAVLLKMAGLKRTDTILMTTTKKGEIKLTKIKGE